MIIKSIEIDGFGKFSNFSVEPQKGFNLVFGNNEDGKTTLMSFVKMMFYSSSSKTEKATDLFKSLRKKYRPWNGSKMQGAVEFEFDGMEFRLQKEFLKSEVSDKTSVFCKTTGEEIQFDNKNDAGEYFFGMTLDEFERSVFIGQNGGFSSDSSSDSLAMRISNLSVSGDESISHEAVTKRLSAAIEELSSKTGKKGLLVDSQKKLDDLKFEEQRLALIEKNQSELDSEISKLKVEILNLEENLKHISENEKLESAKKELNAFYTLHNKQNLLSAEQNRLLLYGIPEEKLREYTKAAKLLNDKIDACLTSIQEISEKQSAASISDEEYRRILKLDEEVSKIRKDIALIEGKIASLCAELAKTLKSEKKKKRLLSIIPLALSLLAAFWILFKTSANSVTAVSILGFGALLTLILFCAAKGLAASSLSMRILKREVDSSLRELSFFSNDILSNNLNELSSYAEVLLSDAVSNLSSSLASYHAGSIAELTQKSAAAQNEELKSATLALTVEKENFVNLASSVKDVSSFSAAKIMYIELSESFASIDSLRAEIDTLCKATGILDASSAFVDNRIKELGELIQNSENHKDLVNLSAEDIRLQIQAKRTKLDEYQAQIVVSDPNLNEIRRQIKEAEETFLALETRYKELTLARDIMNEAILDVNKGLGSQLSNKVGKYLSQLSDGKYSDVIVPRDLSVEIKGKLGEDYHEWKYMSQGAIDRIYLALRLAMLDIIAQEKQALPLFFDDILSQYDEENCKRALSFLKEYLKNSKTASQILFFTCHKHIAELAKDIFSEYSEIFL